MKATAQHLTKSIEANESLTIAERFTNFCNYLEDYRILLLSAFLLIQGCIVVPITLLVTSFIDLGLGGVSVGILAAGTIGVLITNMAETPIKAILFAFGISFLSSIALIAIHLLSL